MNDEIKFNKFCGRVLQLVGTLVVCSSIILFFVSLTKNGLDQRLWAFVFMLAVGLVLMLMPRWQRRRLEKKKWKEFWKLSFESAEQVSRKHPY